MNIAIAPNIAAIPSKVNKVPALRLSANALLICVKNPKPIKAKITVMMMFVFDIRIYLNVSID